MDGVQIDCFNLAIAIALLGFQSPLSTAVWDRMPDPNDDTRTLQIAALFRPWQNWLDIIRAAAGAYLLMKLVFTVDEHIRGAVRFAFLWEAGILMLGVLAQTIRFHKGVRFVGPVFYLSGLVPVISGYVDGGFTVLVAWMFTFVSGSPTYYFLAMSLSLIACGYFGGSSMNVILCVGMSLSPFVLAALFQQRLSFVADERRFGNPGRISGTVD